MIINVTRQHIRRGQKCISYKCPVALALKEKFGPEVEISVGINHFNLGKVRVNFPRKVQTFISRFDNEGSSAVKPFSFKFTI